MNQIAAKEIFPQNIMKIALKKEYICGTISKSEPICPKFENPIFPQNEYTLDYSRGVGYKDNTGRISDFKTTDSSNYTLLYFYVQSQLLSILDQSVFEILPPIFCPFLVCNVGVEGIYLA